MPSVVNPRGREAVWRNSLVLQLQELGRWVEGRFIVEPTASDQMIEAESYLDVDFLRAAIEAVKTTNLAASYRPPEGFDTGGDDQDIDVRIAASRFTRLYCSSISITALTALACGVGLDLSTRRCRVKLRNQMPFFLHLDVDESAILRCRERPAQWPIGEGPVVDSLEELRAHVWRTLYAGNIVPLLERVHQVTKVSQRLMWSNCAESPAMVSDAAEEYLNSGRARAYVEDRIAVLQADALPNVSGPNPMRGLIEWLPTDAPECPHGIQTRKMCCATYLLPDRLGRLCQNCSLLSVEDRVALMRERHGVPMGTPGGPAEQRAIEVGLTRLGYGKCL